MREKHILIVDDEASILSVLKSSLRVLGAGYKVSTAPDGQNAFVQLKQCPFDLVITDYKMAGMDGLELLEAIRSLQPNARAILMTAYGNDKVETEARRLQVYRYLIKPFGVDKFRQIVQSALNDIAVRPTGISILSDERYTQIVLSLNQLRVNVGARCVVLADMEGSCIAHAGNLEGFPLERIAPLLGGCIAGLGEVGRVLDGDKNIINLIYRESPADDLYILNIGAQRLLVIVIDRGPYSSRLGTVWYLAQQVASMLFLKLGQKEYADPQSLFDSGLERAVGSELDKLLCGPDSVKAQTSSNAFSEPCSTLGHVQPPIEGRIATQPSLLSSKQTAQAELMSFELDNRKEREGRR